MRQLCIPILFTSLLLAGCNSKDEKQSTNDNGKAVSVSTYVASLHNFSRTLEIQANILANKQVTLMAKVPGEVKEILVSEGDVVTKGQLLARLDKKDFKLGLRQARAQLAAANAGVQAAKAGLETIDAKQQRLAQLHSKHVISESAYEDVEGGQRATKAQTMIAAAQLQLAKVGVSAAKNNLKYTDIRAPFDGIVAKRMVDEGAQITMMPPTPLMIIVDSSTVKVEGAVPEMDLPFVKIGMPAEITVDALGGETQSGTVARIEPLVDPMSRSATVRVMLPNDDARLSAGMSATLRLDLGNRNSIAVPDDVVIRNELGGNEGKIFIVVNGKAVLRQVSIGQRDDELLEITKGLESGDVIVRGGKEKIKEGQLVNVVKSGGK